MKHEGVEIVRIENGKDKTREKVMAERTNRNKREGMERERYDRRLPLHSCVIGSICVTKNEKPAEGSETHKCCA